MFGIKCKQHIYIFFIFSFYIYYLLEILDQTKMSLYYVENILKLQQLIFVCIVCLFTHHCMLLWQQMLTEPLCKLQGIHPAWER